MAASIHPNNSNSAECSVGRKKKITDSIFLLPSCQQEVVVVVVAHIYPPVTGQRQTLTCWTIRTLFMTRTTS